MPLAGAVIVSTPQDIALLDARKAINMFRKVDVPVLGIVENMTYFFCPNCGQRGEIFGHGGARAGAAQFGVDFLAEIPLDVEIRDDPTTAGRSWWASPTTRWPRPIASSPSRYATSSQPCRAARCGSSRRSSMPEGIGQAVAIDSP